MQLYWNHTFAWVISCKFTVFLQNTFSEKHLWRTASGHLHYNKKRIYTEHIFLSIYWYKVILLKIKISIWISFINYLSYQSVKTIFLWVRTFSFIFIPLHIFYSPFPLLYEDSHPDSPHSHSDSPHSYHFPHFIPWFPIPAFLQIAKSLISW